MKRMLLPIALLLFMTSAAFAQASRCTVSAKDKPSILGFQLGSSFAEIQRDFPQIVKRPYSKPSNVVSIVDTDDASFVLMFDNDSLEVIGGYFNKMETPDMKAFRDFLKSSLALPGAQWTLNGNSKRLADKKIEIETLEQKARDLEKQHGKDDSLVEEVNTRISQLRQEYNLLFQVNSNIVIGCADFSLDASIQPDGVPTFLVWVKDPKSPTKEALIDANADGE